MRSLEERITRLIAREVQEYLSCETEWEPKLTECKDVDGSTLLMFEFPKQAGISNIEVKVV